MKDQTFRPQCLFCRKPDSCVSPLWWFPECRLNACQACTVALRGYSVPDSCESVFEAHCVRASIRLPPLTADGLYALGPVWSIWHSF